MNSKNLTFAVYVTVLLSFCVITHPLKAETPPSGKISTLVKQLGAPHFRDRKNAIKELITLGYYAKKEVRNAMVSADPEVRQNAEAVWKKIQHIITPRHSQEVSEFIIKIKNKSATLSDWLEILQKLDKDSLEVMVKVCQKVQFFKVVKLDPIDHDPFDHDPFDPELNDDDLDNIELEMTANLQELKIFEATIQHFPIKELLEMAQKLDLKDKNYLREIIHHSIEGDSPYEQSLLLQLAATISTDDKLWPVLQKADLYSPLVVSSLPAKSLASFKANFASLEQNRQFTAAHILMVQQQMNQAEFMTFLNQNSLALAEHNTIKIYYHFHKDKIPLAYWQSCFKNSNDPWQQLALLSLQKNISLETIAQLKFNNFSKRSALIKLSDDFLHFSDPRVIPFYLKAAELKQDNSTELFNEQEILINHFSRLGDFTNAHDFLIKYNKENARTDDQNSGFYQQQQKILKPQTVEILKKVAALKELPKQALTHLNEAAKINPGIATIFIQKAEIELQLNLIKEAKASFISANKLLPENAFETRKMINLAFDLNDYELALSQINRLSLSEDNVLNFILGSSAHEFFGKHKETYALQNSIQMGQFCTVRNLYYQKQYSKIPALCTRPDEGDFQFLWGMMSLLNTDNEAAVIEYMKAYSFVDTWPETIAYMLSGQITPDQLIAECTSITSKAEQQGRLTEAYFYIACKLLKEKPEIAKEFYQKSVNIRFREYYEYVAAAAMLKTLK